MANKYVHTYADKYGYNMIHMYQGQRPQEPLRFYAVKLFSKQMEIAIVYAEKRESSRVE